MITTVGGRKDEGRKRPQEKGERITGLELGKNAEDDARVGQQDMGITCWRLLLHTQCCQPPSAPLEARQDVQLGRRWQGVGQGSGGDDSTGIGDTFSREWLKQVQS